MNFQPRSTFKPHKIKPATIADADSLAVLRRHNMHDLASIMIQAGDKQKTIETRLSFDQSRTELAANIDAAKQGKKRLNDLDVPFLKVGKATRAIVEKFQERAAPLREIRGSTDLLILQNYMPLIKKKSDLFRLAEVDQDAARLGLLPLIKHEFKLTKADHDRLDDVLNKHVLGADYPKLQAFKKDAETLDQVRDAIFKNYEATLSEITRLSKTIVELPAEPVTA